MKNFLAAHPYTITSGIFLTLMAFGFHYLNWGRDEYAFALLLYFIVTLGIRLDDIARQLDNGTLPEKNDRIIHLMQQIQRNLAETNDRLAEIQSAMDRKTEL